MLPPRAHPDSAGRQLQGACRTKSRADPAENWRSRGGSSGQLGHGPVPRGTPCPGTPSRRRPLARYLVPPQNPCASALPLGSPPSLVLPCTIGYARIRETEHLDAGCAARPARRGAGRRGRAWPPPARVSARSLGRIPPRNGPVHGASVRRRPRVFRQRVRRHGALPRGQGGRFGVRPGRPVHARPLRAREALRSERSRCRRERGIRLPLRRTDRAR